jgi:hypothetical protein
MVFNVVVIAVAGVAVSFLIVQMIVDLKSVLIPTAFVVGMVLIIVLGVWLQELSDRRRAALQWREPIEPSPFRVMLRSVKQRVCPIVEIR